MPKREGRAEMISFPQPVLSKTREGKQGGGVNERQFCAKEEGECSKTYSRRGRGSESFPTCEKIRERKREHQQKGP